MENFGEKVSKRGAFLKVSFGEVTGRYN